MLITEVKATSNSLIKLGELKGGVVDRSLSYRLIFSKVNLPKGRILDVGSHVARFDKWLKSINRVADVTSVDIREFKGVEGENLIRTTARNLPFPDEIFDEVVSFGAIPCFCPPGNEEASINEMVRVARKRILLWPVPDNSANSWRGRYRESDDTNVVNDSISSLVRGLIIPNYSVAVQTLDLNPSRSTAPLFKVIVITKM